jgi:hypothetical protein
VFYGSDLLDLAREVVDDRCQRGQPSRPGEAGIRDGGHVPAPAVPVDGGQL